MRASATAVQLAVPPLWKYRANTDDKRYGAQLQGASLLGARLQGAVLDGAQLQGAVLDGAQLQGASLGLQPLVS
jgi:uncharacterized protein YjbI with pentapeptide repeats